MQKKSLETFLYSVGGVVAMARTQAPNSAGSQFYITLATKKCPFGPRAIPEGVASPCSPAVSTRSL